VWDNKVAERVGFEPTVRLRVQRFSRPPRSTAPASLLGRISLIYPKFFKIVQDLKKENPQTL
jgi:hypothetical protein